jgi:hypothetical protein
MVNSSEPASALSASEFSSPEERNPDLIASLRAPVIVLGDSTHLPASIRAGKTLAVFHPGADATRRGNKIYLLDGVGIAGSTTVIDSEGVANFLDRNLQHESSNSVADRWGKGVKNPCAAFVIDLDAQQILCLPDPLGGALAFRYRSNSAQIISTDMVSLANVVTAMKLPLRKSADFQLERLILGNGGLTPSSYEDVDRLDPFEYWQVSKDGAKRGRYAQDDSEPTYVESVQAIRDEFIESVLAVSKLPSERRIAHITGGFDSRLVLAAAMAAGCAKDFMYFCSGPAGSTDRKIADGLSLTLDLPRSSGGGLAASPLARVHEQLLAPLYHSGGITSSGPNGGESRSSVVVAGGGYGGILRSTFSSRFSAIAPEDVSPASLMDKLAPRSAGNAQIYAESTLSSLGQKLFQEWQKLRDQGYEHDSVGDAFYLAVRNRYHFGQNSMLWSRVGRRYDPLYSVSAATAAARLPLYSRQTNVLGFDIMESFGFNIEKYPFDKNRFTDAYKTLRRAPLQLELSFAGPVKFDNSHQISYGGNVSLPSALEGLAVTSPTLTDDERKVVIEKANKIGLNYWHIATLKPAQKSLRAGLNEFGLAAIDGLVDSEYAWHLAKGRLTKRAEIRDLYSMYGLVAWLGVNA